MKKIILKFSKLRDATTKKLHNYLSNKILLYKKWHNFKFHHHVHVITAIIVLFLFIFSLIISPTDTYAALTQQTKSITSATQFNQGELSNTNTNGDQLELGSLSLSNSGGGDWNYRKKITIDNSAGGALTDYQVAVDSEKDLVGHYNFDESSGTANDSSFLINNCTNLGGVTYSTGKFGNAATFDQTSTDYFNCGTTMNSYFDSNDSWTIDGWIYPTSYPSQWYWIVSKAYTSHISPYYQFDIRYNPTGNVIAKVWDLDLEVSSPIGSAPINTWTHFAVSFDLSNKVLKLYLNAQEVSSDNTWTGTYNNYNSALSLGQNINIPTSTVYTYTGKMDELKISSKILNLSEIRKNFEHKAYKSNFFNNIQSNGNDIRFTDSDGKTELPYWIETINNSSTGKKNYKIWVKTSVGAGTSKDIYMYYGNSSATSSSNGNNVFTFFDDFNDSSLDTTNKWTVSTGNPTESGGYLNLKRSTIDNIKSKTTFTMPFITESSIKKMNFANSSYESSSYNVTTSSGPIDSLSLAGYYSGRCANPMPRLEVYDDGVWGGSALCFNGKVITDSQFHNYKMDIQPSSQSGSFDGYKNTWNKNFNTGQSYNITYNTYDNTYGSDIYVDWSFVRQYASVEPNIFEYGGLARMQYKKDIVFNTSATGANVSTDQYDFPIAVHLNTSSWPTQSERDAFFDNAGSTGKGVQFWESDESFSLDYEVEYFNNTQGNEEAIYWVRVPKIDGNSSTDKIKIAYGRNTGQDESNAVGVWSKGYNSVYHLGSNSWGSSPEGKDSLSINNVYNSGTTNSISQIKDGRALNGTNQFLYKDSSVLGIGGNNKFTIEAWVYPSVFDSNSRAIATIGDEYGYRPFIYLNNNTLYWRVGDGGVTNYKQIVISNFFPSTNTWYHIMAVYDGGLIKVYLNGVEKSGSVTGSYSGNIPSITTYHRLGGGYRTGYGNVYYFLGSLDEVRVSNYSYSDDWSKLSYYSTAKNNYNGDNGYNSPFISFGLQSLGNYSSFGYQTSGTYLSPTDDNIIDFGWTGGWGSSIKNFEADVDIPSGTSINFEARTSYDKSNWTLWVNIGTAISSGVFQDNDNIDGLTVQDSNGNYRYIQIKATFFGDGSSTPVLSEFRIIYMADISDPHNPTSVRAYNDSGMGFEINNNSWTNETTPYFNWTDYSDGVGESGIDCFYVYFGTDINADPQTAGLEISGNKCHSLANIDLSLVDTNPLVSAVSGQTYYLRIDTKDIAGNVADMPNGESIFTYKFDNTQPTNITSISRDPVGYSSVNSFSFDWPDPGQENGASDDYSNICSYEYKRSPDSSWSQVSVSNVSGILAYQQGINSFYVRAKDCAGNVSATSIKIDYYYSSAAPSAPTNLLVDGLSYIQKNENLFTFTWDDPDQINGSSIIEFCYSVNITPREGAVTCTSNKTTGPIPAATIQGDNRFFVVAKNDLNNINYDNYAEILFGANTVAPSIPTNVNITDSSNRAANQWSLTTSWNPSTGNVNHYNIYRSNDGVNWGDPIATTKSTGYFDSGNLSQNQRYYYRITAEDNAGAESAPSSIVSDEPTGKYTSPPNIVSGPTVSATAIGAVITWSTDRASSSFVEYSTDESFNLSNGSLIPTTSHKVELSGLTPSTNYKFRVQSLDEDRDYSPSSAYSSVFNFNTSQAPGISEVKVSEIGLYSAIVTWKTTSSATSAIKYGPTTSYGSVISDTSGSSVTVHTIKISNLNHSSTYNFKIYGTDIDNNYMESDNYVFTTLVFPKISNVRFEGLKNTATSTMKVTWDSNVPLSSVVEFKELGGQAKEASSSKLVEKHEMIISGLKDNTDYLITVKGRDAYGNEAISDVNKVRTDFDTRPPEIFNISVETSVIGSGLDAKVQAIISWETDEVSTSQVEYAVGITGNEYTYKSQEDTTLTTTHVVVISDLKPATTYHFRVVSKDAAKNEGLSSDSYFLTEQASDSILGLILRSIEKAFGWLFNL